MIRSAESGATASVALDFDVIGDGPPVVLLHGFPEFRRAWRHQLPALARAGFRAIAPDLRGYGRSPQPRGVRAYRLELLVEDVAALIRRQPSQRAVIVGHDWGGVLAWLLAGRYPELIERLLIINAPHPIAYAREIRRPRQALRSWYAAFFQLPGIPELLLRAGDFHLLRRLFARSPQRRGAFDAAEIERYVETFRPAGALTAALNYYRAARRFGNGELIRTTRRIMAPTLVLWGQRDRYLSDRLLVGLERWVPDLRIVRLDTTHWVQHDAPEEVNALMLEFLGGPIHARQHV